MKHYLYYVLGLCLVLGAASCKKDEPNQNPPKPTPVAPVEEKIPEGVTATYWQVEGKSTDGKESQRLSLDFRPDGTYSVTYRTGAGESEARGLQSARALEWEVYSFSGKYSYRDGKLTILTIEYDRADGVEAGSPKIEEMKGYAQSLVGRVFRVNESERTLTLTDEKPSPSAGDVTGPFRLFILTPATSTPTVKSALESARRRVDSLSRLVDAEMERSYKAYEEVRRLQQQERIVRRHLAVTPSGENRTAMEQRLANLHTQINALSDKLLPSYEKVYSLEIAYIEDADELNQLQSRSGVAASPRAFVGSWRFFDRYGKDERYELWNSVCPNHAEITPFEFEKYLQQVKTYRAINAPWYYQDEGYGIELKELRINADGTGYADYRQSNPSLVVGFGEEFRIPFTYVMGSDRTLYITTPNVFGDARHRESSRYSLTLETDKSGGHYLMLHYRVQVVKWAEADSPDRKESSVERERWLFYQLESSGTKDVLRIVKGNEHYVIDEVYYSGIAFQEFMSYSFRRADN